MRGRLTLMANGSDDGIEYCKFVGNQKRFLLLVGIAFLAAGVPLLVLVRVKSIRHLNSVAGLDCIKANERWLAALVRAFGDENDELFYRSEVVRRADFIEWRGGSRWHVSLQRRLLTFSAFKEENDSAHVTILGHCTRVERSS